MSVAIFGSIFLSLSQGLPTSGAASPGVAKHSRLQISPELTCRCTFIGIEAASLQEKTKRTVISSHCFGINSSLLSVVIVHIVTGSGVALVVHLTELETYLLWILFSY